MLDVINKLNIENCNIFNENNEKIKFICNVIKYDKLLLNNDIDSLVEINYNDLSNSRFSFEDLIKNHNLVEQ